MEEKTDVGLKHVAHQHLLILNENYIAKDGEFCSACREQIDSCKSFVYSCGNTTSTNGVEENCVQFLLHRTCAELARETVNPTNQNEFFTFFPIPKIVFPCMLCFLPWEWFSYGRSSDNSFFCFKCAVLLFQQSRKDPKFEHPGHSHPLAFIEHPSSFKCYACKVNDNVLDLSYRCTECQFLIHKSCGDAPASFQFQFHKHPLILSFSLPQLYHSFFQHCRLCNKTVSRIEWLYCCRNCRYFTHFQCARSSPMLRYSRTYKHRWDPHPLELIYDAGMVEEHEHEYECENCSKEIDTNRWFYHCSKCDLSIHPGCIEKLSYGSYKCVKFGATDINRVKLHPHKLTYVLNQKVRRCDKCGKQSFGQPVLQCAPCNTIFCSWCW